MRELNKIREKLLSSFESVDVSILPVPCDTSNEEIRDLDFLKTSEEFQEGVHELKKTILDQMKEARYFGNTIVHSENANFFVEKFVQELQEGDVVHLKSAVAQFQRGIVNAAKRLFEETLVKAFEEIDVPVMDGIEKMLTQQKDARLKAFEESTAKVDVEATYRDEVLEKLEEFSDREVETKRRENLLAIQSKEAEQKSLLKKAVQEFRAAVESELRRSKEASSKEMRREFETSKQRMEERFLKSTDDLNWIRPELVENELKRLRSWATARLEFGLGGRKSSLSSFCVKKLQLGNAFSTGVPDRNGTPSLKICIFPTLEFTCRVVNVIGFSKRCHRRVSRCCALEVK